ATAAARAAVLRVGRDRRAHPRARARSRRRLHRGIDPARKSRRGVAKGIVGPNVLVAALANIAMGLGFALIARDRVRADGPFGGPAFLFVVLHAAVVVA